METTFPLRCITLIRSEEACYISSSKAVALAKKTGARLHIFHLSTAKEMEFVYQQNSFGRKENHCRSLCASFWFTDEDYAKLKAIL
jgi:dihydroorotase